MKKQTRLLIADELSGKTEFSRHLSHGYKKVVVDDGLDSQLVKIVTEQDADGNDILHIVADTEHKDTGYDDEDYLVLATQIGLSGAKDGVYADISYLFCDNGVMLVTLHHGAMFLHLGGEVLMPSVDIDGVANMSFSSIFWGNAEWLQSFNRNWGTEYDLYPYDVEFSARVTGQLVANSLTNTSIKPDKKNFKDISNGVIETFRQHEKAKADLANARSIANMAFNGGSKFEFDDDDDTDSEDGEYADEADDIDFI